ncbi:MAG: hypothetical protein ABL958_12450, partial [Bdellovibrionia bacterium]
MGRSNKNRFHLFAANISVLAVLVLALELISFGLNSFGFARDGYYKEGSRHAGGRFEIPSSFREDWPLLHPAPIVPAFDRSKIDVSGKNAIDSSTVKLTDGSIVYSVHPSTDSLGRRTTVFDSTRARKKHLIFFGCSFTWGEGVEDFETLPSQIASKFK